MRTLLFVEELVEVVIQVLGRGNKSLAGHAYKAEGLRFLPRLRTDVGTEIADSVEVGEELDRLEVRLSAQLDKALGRVEGVENPNVRPLDEGLLLV